MRVKEIKHQDMKRNCLIVYLALMLPADSADVTNDTFSIDIKKIRDGKFCEVASS